MHLEPTAQVFWQYASQSCGQIVSVEYFGIFWNILEYFGIFWNILDFLEYLGIFWNFLEFFEIFWTATSLLIWLKNLRFAPSRINPMMHFAEN